MSLPHAREKNNFSGFFQCSGAVIVSKYILIEMQFPKVQVK